MPRRQIALALLALSLAACGGDEEEAIETAPPAVTIPTVETSAGEEPAVLEITVQKGRPIGPGSHGGHVADLQQALTELGYKPGDVDGFYGPRARKAIIAFQRDHRLKPDGLVGVKTARAINEELRRKAAGSTG